MATETYIIGLRHHSIAESAELSFQGTLPQAKRLATREFGAGFIDHNIVIVDRFGNLVASRRIGDDRWINADPDVR